MVVMGRVVAPFGVKGWIKVQPFTQHVGMLSTYREWWVGREGDFVARQVAESAIHGQLVLARLEDCGDREDAAKLKGQEIAVPRELLPAVDVGAFYWDDLIGCVVVNKSDDRLGSVSRVLETGANSVLVVQGDRERLLPFVEGVILDVNIGSARILVDWGLDY
jgi:16S rRNA processing protein RimM